MNIASVIKPFYKHLFALVVFFILTLVTFFPLFQGKVLPQHDIKMWKGSAQECLDYRGSNNGEETLWTNSMFGGMPSYLISTKYPNNLTKQLEVLISFNLPSISKIIFASLFSFYICLLCFKVRWEIAIFGSIAFTFTTFNLIRLRCLLYTCLCPRNRC